MVADTLRLPGTVRLTADTTIIAGTIEFPGNRAAIDGQGHAITFLPIDGIRWGADASGAAARAEAPIASEITIRSGVLTKPSSGSRFRTVAGQ